MNENLKEAIMFRSELHYFSMKGNGEYRLELDVPFSEMASSLSMIRFLGKEFNMILYVDGNSVEIKSTYLFKLTVNKDGDSRLSFIFGNDNNGSVATLLNSSVEKVITVKVE